MNDTEEFRSFLIARSGDPKYPLTATERALYSLISLPKAAQEICSEQEREAVIQTVRTAIEAAVQAALKTAEVSAKGNVT